MHNEYTARVPSARPRRGRFARLSRGGPARGHYWHGSPLVGRLSSAAVVVWVLVMSNGVSAVRAHATDDLGEPVQVAEQLYDDCGTSCVFIAMHLLDTCPTLDSVRKLLPRSASQANSLGQLSDAAESLGAHTLGVSVKRRHASDILVRPSVLHVRSLQGQPQPDHFVVFLGFGTHDDVLIINPPHIIESIPMNVFARLWDGNALLMFQTEAQRSKVESDLKRLPEPLWRIPWFWTLLAVALCVIGMPLRRRL